MVVHNIRYEVAENQECAWYQRGGHAWVCFWSRRWSRWRFRKQYSSECAACGAHRDMTFRDYYTFWWRIGAGEPVRHRDRGLAMMSVYLKRMPDRDLSYPPTSSYFEPRFYPWFGRLHGR